MYCCADGKWVCVCLPEYDRDFTKMCSALNMDPQEILGIDPEANVCARVNAKGLNTSVVDVLDKHFAKFTQAEVLATFRANDMPCEPAATPLDIYEDQNCWDNDMLAKVSYPSGDRITATCPIHFDSQPVANLQPCGSMGSATEEVMAKLGYDQDAIAAAIERGDVRGATSIFA